MASNKRPSIAVNTAADAMPMPSAGPGAALVGADRLQRDRARRNVVAELACPRRSFRPGRPTPKTTDRPPNPSCRQIPCNKAVRRPRARCCLAANPTKWPPHCCPRAPPASPPAGLHPAALPWPCAPLPAPPGARRCRQTPDFTHPACTPFIEGPPPGRALLWRKSLPSPARVC